MPFKVLYRNLEVVCETIEDIDALADRQEQRNGLKNKPTNIEMSQTEETSKTPETNQQSGNGVVKEVSVQTFLKSLNDNTMKVLNVLAESPDGLSDAEIRGKLNIDSKVVLAGIMSAIAKSANTLGIGYENVVTKTVTNKKHGDMRYHYALNENVKKELLNGSPN